MKVKNCNKKLKNLQWGVGRVDNYSPLLHLWLEGLQYVHVEQQQHSVR